MTKKIFISHNHEDKAGCDKLKKLLEDAGFDVVAESGTDAIDFEASKLQIEQCDILVVYMTESIEQSELAKLEFEYAEQIRKRIVAVYPYNRSGYKVPTYIDDNADALKSWVGDGIISGVNGCNKSTDENGLPRKKKKIPHYVCKT